MAGGFFTKLKEGLAKTRSGFVANLDQVFSGYRQLDDEFYSDLEDTLIMADVGLETAAMLMEKLKKQAREEKITDPAQLKAVLIREIGRIFAMAGSKPLDFTANNKIYLIVGVNGVGKTTTIAKLASKFKAAGQDVLLVAGDTFRAAATEQLMLWGERLGISVIHHQEGADPAAVVFDGLSAAKARRSGIVIIDTAGRLHTKINLMEEIKKVKRVVSQNLDGRELITLLVLDATTGQNAINQTQVFHEALEIQGLILTKLDGTAKGGIVLAIANRFNLPIHLIGVGEKADDLQDFEPHEFTRAMFE